MDKEECEIDSRFGSSRGERRGKGQGGKPRSENDEAERGSPYPCVVFTERDPASHEGVDIREEGDDEEESGSDES